MKLTGKVFAIAVLGAGALVAMPGSASAAGCHWNGGENIELWQFSGYSGLASGFNNTDGNYAAHDGISADMMYNNSCVAEYNLNDRMSSAVNWGSSSVYFYANAGHVGLIGSLNGWNNSTLGGWMKNFSGSDDNVASSHLV